MRKAEIDKAWKDCRAISKGALKINKITTRTGDAYVPINVDSRILAAVGSNGAGKTTWLRQLAGVMNGNVFAKGRKHIEVTEISGVYRGEDLNLPLDQASNQ